MRLPGSLRKPWVLAFAALLLAVGCDTSDDAGAGNTIETGKGIGEACALDVNCRTGLACREGACGPAGTAAAGAACTLSAECAEGLYCAPTFDSDPRILPRMTCAAAGTAMPGEPCESTADCTSGLLCLPLGFSLACQESGSVDLGGACSAVTDCMAGMVCVDGACASSPTWTPLDDWERPPCPDPGGGPRVLFEVPRTGVDLDFYALPFPNDIRLVNGHPDLSGHASPPLSGYAGPIVQRYLESIARDLDGFSQNPTVIFRFSTPIDLTTLRDGDQLRAALFDVTDPQAPDYGEPRGMSWTAATGPGSGGLYMCDNWLGLQVPWGRPLEPGHTYAVVLYSGITTERGVVLQPSSDFAAMLAATPPTDAALARAYEAYAPLRELIAATPLEATQLAAATVFTTQTSERLVPALREAVRAEGAPTLEGLVLCDAASTPSPCDDRRSASRGCADAPSESFHELQARVGIPLFQRGVSPYFDPASGGGIALSSSGAPQVQRTEEVCVSMTVPKKQAMPESGWPLILYAHGSGGDYRQHITRGFAQLAAELQHEGLDAGAVVLGWDAVVHGERRGDSTMDPKDLYFNFANPPAARGHVLQGVADVFQLVRLGEVGFELSADVSPTGEPIRIDPERIYVVAHSQGTHYATIALAHEPLLEAGVLSGAGAGLTRGMLEKTQPLNIAAGVRMALADPDVSEYHPALALVQTYLDGADAINYAEEVLYRPLDESDRPHLFHLIGLGDHYTPDQTQRDLAVGLGAILVVDEHEAFGGVNTTTLPVIGPNFADVTALARQYTPDGSYDGHFVAQQHPRAVADLAQFLASLIATGTPSLR